MRLLNVGAAELELKEFFGEQIPPYAILSHTWGQEEVLFRDLERGLYKHKLGYKKIEFTCEQARRDGLQWCWVDTCCIDKSSSAELSEAINSMFNWYKRAQVCYAYLADVNVSEKNIASEEKWPEVSQAIVNTDGIAVRCESERPVNIVVDSLNPILKAVKDSRWFGRGWTLQELIAPRTLQFYDVNWHDLGSRDSELAHVVHERTGLDSGVLGEPQNLRSIPIAQRMSWMAHRRTTRKEDESYCMLGIFGVNLPLLYGEEDHAFIRLQEELIRRFCDHSLLIYHDQASYGMRRRRILASSPRDFAWCNDIQTSLTFQNLFPLQSFSLINDGLQVSLPLIQSDRLHGGLTIALLGYMYKGLPIGLVLSLKTLHNDRHERYVDNTSSGILEDRARVIRQLVPGIVSMKEEVAVTAQREMFLIKQAPRFDDVHYEDFSSDLWLRYDDELRYEFKSPDYVPARTVAHGDIPRPHMIRLKGLRGQPTTAMRHFAALKFSLKRIWPSVIVIALTRYQECDIRGALAVTRDKNVENQEQLSVLGAELLDATKDVVLPYMSADGVLLNWLRLKNIGRLELWHDGTVGDATLGRGRATLRFESLMDGRSVKRLLSDGTRYEAEDLQFCADMRK